ncbi:MAG: hypothetical protein GX254_09700 [Clostridiales bacterium]|nr:hypothetical protein [Clostridiales bacterium]
MGLNENQRYAIEKYYYEMYYALLAYAKSALNERSLAEEAVQDTFRIACAKADDFLSSSNPNGWLLNTLKNVIHNMIRSRAYLNRILVSSWDFDMHLFQDTNSPDPDFIYSDLVDCEDYKLIKKIALDKYTILEVAQELGISVEACKKRVQRAKKRLKAHFEKNY